VHKEIIIKARKNAIVKYLDYKIPVTQLKGPKGKRVSRSETKMRHLPAVDRLKRYWR